MKHYINNKKKKKEGGGEETSTLGRTKDIRILF